MSVMLSVCQPVGDVVDGTEPLWVPLMQIA